MAMNTASKRAEQLKALKMPKKTMAEEEAGQDLELLGEEEPDMGDEKEPEEMMAGEAPEIEPMSELADLSDDDLIAEMKKRGLLEEENEPEEGMEEILVSPKKKA